MRHERQRWARPPSDNGPVIVVVLLFVVGIGVALYYVMKEPTPTTRTDTIAGPTAPPSEGAPPPAARVDASGVLEEYDRYRDRLKTSAPGILLRDGAGERFTLDVSWSNPGRTPLRPVSPIIWAVERRGSAKALAEDHAIDLRTDVKPVRVEGSTYDTQRKDDGVMEVVRFSTNLDDLQRAATGSRVALRVGVHAFELTDDAMGRLRALAARVPGG